MFTLPLLATIPCPSPQCYTPSTSTFNSTAFSAWLLSQAGAPSLRVAPGAYTLPPPTGRAHLVLPPLTATNLDFTGVTLVCADRKGAGVYLSQWVGSTLAGLSLRYAAPPSSSVAVTAVGAGTVDVEVEGGHPADDYTDGSVASCNVFTADSRLRKPLSFDVYVTAVAPLGGAAFRLTVANEGQLAGIVPGDLLGCRVPGGGMTVTIDGAINSTFSDVTLFGGPAFGFLEAAGGGNTYLRPIITYPDPPPGAAHPPLLSTSADGLHSSGARVGPRVEGAHFQGMDDDGIAVHGGFMLVTDAEAAGSGGRLWATLHGALQAGDRLLLYDKAFAPAPLPLPPSFLPAYYTVLAVAPAPHSYAPPFNASKTMPSQKLPAQGGYQIITLGGAPLPPAVGFDFVASNADAVGSHFLLRNNTILNHRARGMLIKASHGVIEGNRITNSSLGGIIVTPELYWEEASYAHNVTVFNNTVTLTSSGSQSYGGIALGAVAPNGKLVAAAPGHSAVAIVDNTLVDCGYAPLWLNAGGNVSVVGNRLVAPFHAPTPAGLPHCCEPLPNEAIAVFASGVLGLRVEGNCVQPAPPGESSLAYLFNVTNSSGAWEGGVVLC